MNFLNHSEAKVDSDHQENIKMAYLYAFKRRSQEEWKKTLSSLGPFLHKDRAEAALIDSPHSFVLVVNENQLQNIAFTSLKIIQVVAHVVDHPWFQSHDSKIVILDTPDDNTKSKLFTYLTKINKKHGNDSN